MNMKKNLLQKLISWILIVCFVFIGFSCAPSENNIVPDNPDIPSDPIIPDPIDPVGPDPADPVVSEPFIPKNSISELSWTRSINKISPIGDLAPYSDHHFDNTDLRKYDLSKNLSLATSLSFGERTLFPTSDKLPKGFDSTALLEWGKYPGLNLDILHKYGYDGKGAVLGYVDQTLGYNHPEFSNSNYHYYPAANGETFSMHGPAVLSLLVGKNIGTAPKTEVYFFEAASWTGDQFYEAQAFLALAELNKTLPENEKIRLIGISHNIDSSLKNSEVLAAAIETCRKEGIMVFLCGEPITFRIASFIPMSDKNNPNNVVASYLTSDSKSLYVPTGGRTSAGMYSNDHIYWGEGGVSWATPYVLGLAGTAVTIDPDLTEELVVSLLLSTAYEVNGIRLINPAGFICEVLRRKGKIKEAQQIEEEIAARQKYTYAVINSQKMTKEDIVAITNYLSTFTDEQILLIDVPVFKKAEEIYEYIKADASERRGLVKGIMLFGNRDIILSFLIDYEVQMQYSIDYGGQLYTDFFYSSFKFNMSVVTNGFSVYDNYKDGLSIELIPDYKVTRLMLPQGSFSEWFENYYMFVSETGFENNPVVNFSNPIFATSNSIDDFGVFMANMKNAGILNTPTYSYANLEGYYPVIRKDVLGGFKKENIKKVNSEGIREIIINTHGQWNNMDQTTFQNSNPDSEQRTSFLNKDNINAYLSEYAYYLDMWSCSNAYDLKNNIIEETLLGKCVGAFAASSVISNNGVYNRASIEEMKNNNFYYFYYIYFSALSAEYSRSDAFFMAQKAYGEVLSSNSKHLDYAANYQFNMYNLLAYHNFGVFESSSFSLESVNCVPLFDINNLFSEPIEEELIGEIIKISFISNPDKSNPFKIVGITAQKTNTNKIVLEITINAPFENLTVCAFSPPNGDIFMEISQFKNNSITTTITIDCELIKQTDFITLSLYTYSSNVSYVFVSDISLYNLKKLARD